MSLATSLVTGAINVLKSLPGKARSAVSSLKSNILSAFSGAGSWLVSAGGDIIRGLISGITGMIGAAVSAAKRAVGNIVSGAKSALGIGSPSKVMAKEVGRWLLPGVTMGAKKTIGRAKKTMGTVVRSIVPGGGPRRSFSPPPGWDPRGGDGGTMISIGSITLDASRMKSIQDVVDMVTGITTTARSFRAATAPSPGRA